MKVFRRWTCFLTAISLATGAEAAQVIDWYSPPGQTNLTSAGSAMGGAFQFQIGVFANGFVPTTSNMADWAANWVPADSSSYNPAVNARSYESSFAVTGNVPHFTVGTKTYVWGMAPGSANDEWILFRSTGWTWPAASLSNPPPLPRDWSADLADVVILGTIHPSGAPFLMQSAAVMTYQQWKAAALVGQPLDSPNDDPDHDGVSNLLEFIFGTSPTLRGSPPATPTTLVDVSGQKHLQITILRLRDRLASVAVEVSSDLVSWQSGATATSEVTNTAELLVVRDLTPVGPGLPKRFMRLKAVLRP